MKIYNTLSKQKEEFQPIEEGKVRIDVYKRQEQRMPRKNLANMKKWLKI